VLNDTYQRERCIGFNDIMVPACGLNLCEVKTWELEEFEVCVSPGQCCREPCWCPKRNFFMMPPPEIGKGPTASVVVIITMRIFLLPIL